MKRALAFASLALAVSLGVTAPPPHFSVLKKISIPGDSGWDYLKMDSDAHRLYISRGTHVMVLDVDTEKIVGDIPDTSGVHGIAIAPKAGRGYTSNGRDNSVTVFDTATLQTITKIPVGEGPDAIIYDPATNRVFTMCGEGQEATAIDVATNKVVGNVKLEGDPEYPQPDGHGHIFVNIADRSLIEELDSKALTSLGTWPLAPGEEPSGLSIDAKHHFLFSTCRNGMLAVSDTTQRKVVATPKIGRGPDAAAFDPGLGLAFSSNGGDGTLTIVQRQRDGSFSVVDDVKTQVSARTMALDPKTHRIYLIAATFEQPTGSAPAGGRQRRRVAPGSTVILVVGPQ
jgi:YVTN family beta-propeller protein